MNHKSKSGSSSEVMSFGLIQCPSLSNKRLSELMIVDFRATMSKLNQAGFDEADVWNLIEGGNLPNLERLQDYFERREPKKKPKYFRYRAIQYRQIFAYLIHLQRGLRQVLRDDEDAMQELGDLNVTEVSTTETRANYLLLGYFLGQSGSAIHEPDKFLKVLSEGLSARMRRAGEKKKGVVTSPATKAINLALEYGHTTGKKVRLFFNETPILDAIDVDIELIDEGQERLYRFCGLDESKDTELSEKEIDVRVSQLKKEYLQGN